MNKDWFALVLWWWWARWLAHIWVWKAIQEKWIQIDEIVWTSMVAIIWWAAALGYSHNKILDARHELKLWKLIDIRFWKFSIHDWLVHWNQLLKHLDTLYNYSTFDDCVIPFKTCVTKIDSWSVCILNTWNIAWAVRGSSAFPGVFAPHSIDWISYSDWWLCANLPVCHTNNKSIIASSVLWPYTSFTSKKNIQTEIESVMAIMLKEQEDRDLQLCSWSIQLIRPEVHDTTTFDFSNADELIDIGYKQALKILEHWTI